MILNAWPNILFYILDIDIQVVDVEYMDDVPITRDLPRLHNFSAVIRNPSDYDIISLEGEYLYNFKLQYFYSAEPMPNITSVLSNADESSLSRELYQVGISQSSTAVLPFRVMFILNLTKCEELAFVCVAVSDLPLASWKEAQTFNNMMCVDIKERLSCHPGENPSVL